MTSRRARAYSVGVILVGALLSGFAVSGVGHPMSQWPAFLILAPLCVFSQFYELQDASHEALHANLAFLFAGLLLLPPPCFSILVIIPHLAEWLKERLTNSASPSSWYT